MVFIGAAISLFFTLNFLLLIYFPENVSDFFLFLFFGLLGLLTVLLLLHFLELDLVLLFLHLLSFRWRNDLNLQVQAFPHHFISFQLLHCIPCGIWFLDWIWFNPAKFKSFI